jgi:hypothetical protein
MGILFFPTDWNGRRRAWIKSPSFGLMWPLHTVSSILLHSFFASTFSIGRATGNDQGIPPWTSIVQHPDMYFDPEQLPEGFTLLDPSKMKDPQIQHLLNYWYDRQQFHEKGVGFQFQVDPNVQVRKQSHSRSEFESDSESEEEGRMRKRPRSGKAMHSALRREQGQNGEDPVPGMGKGNSQGPRNSIGMGPVRAKGTGMATEPGTGTGDGNNRETAKGKARESDSWLYHIQPDSRRRKREGSVRSSVSGEDFDFSEVDKMPDSDDDPTRPGPSTLHMKGTSKSLTPGKLRVYW